jgi:hypothetical protein
MHDNVTLRRVHKTTIALKKRWVGITYFCVRARVDVLIQHAKRMRHLVIRGLSGSTTFFDIIS